MRTVGKDLEKVEPLHFAGVMENGAVSVGSSLVSLQKVKHRITIASLVLGIYITKFKTGTNTCTQTLIAALFTTAKRQKQIPISQ